MDSFIQTEFKAEENNSICAKICKFSNLNDSIQIYSA